MSEIDSDIRQRQIAQMEDVITHMRRLSAQFAAGLLATPLKRVEFNASCAQIVELAESMIRNIRAGENIGDVARGIERRDAFREAFDPVRQQIDKNLADAPPRGSG